MRITAGIITLALLATGASAAAEEEKPGRVGRVGRVVLIGVDGGSWTVIDPLLAEGALPHLAALAERGVTAELETVEPVISPVVWSSIATGRMPEDHGISDFLKTGIDRRVPSIFERLAARGKRVGLYEYLVTWPPRTLPDGFVVPGWLRRDDRTAPPDVLETTLGMGMGTDPAPFRYRVRGLRYRDEYRAMVEQELAHKARQWNRLMEAWALDVGAVSFYAVDALSHRFWHEPEVIRDVTIGVDRAIGEIVAALGPEDRVIVASDHGFQAADPPRTVWSGSLEEPIRVATGLVAEQDPFVVMSQFGVAVLRVNAGPFEEREAVYAQLAELFREATNADGEPLFVVDQLDEAERPPEARRSPWNRLWQWALRRFARWRYNAHFDPNAHGYLVARFTYDGFGNAWPDGKVRFGGREMPVADLAVADDFTGEHDEVAIFLAAGGPIRAIAERQRLSVLEIAPLIAVLAGEPVPDDLPGAVRTDLLVEGALGGDGGVRRASAEAWPRLPRLEETGLPVDDAEMLERLRRLGYVE